MLVLILWCIYHQPHPYFDNSMRWRKSKCKRISNKWNMHKYQVINQEQWLWLFDAIVVRFVCPFYRHTQSHQTHAHKTWNAKQTNKNNSTTIETSTWGVHTRMLMSIWDFHDSWLLKQLENTNKIQCSERPQLQLSYNCVTIDFDTPKKEKENEMKTKSKERDENTLADVCNLCCCTHCLN